MKLYETKEIIMKNKTINQLGLWTAIGIGLGAALSSAFEIGAVGWAIGIGLGIAIGVATSRRDQPAKE